MRVLLWFWVFRNPDGAANIFPASAGQIVWSNLFCLDISYFWPDNHRLRLTFCIAIKMPPLQTSKFSKHLLYMSSNQSQFGKSGTHGTAKTVSHLGELLSLQFYILYTCTVSYEVAEIDWGLQSSWFSS